MLRHRRMCCCFIYFLPIFVYENTGIFTVLKARSKKSKSARVEGWDRKQGIKPSKHDIFKKTKMLRCKGTYAGQVSIVIGIVEEK